MIARIKEENKSAPDKLTVYITLLSVASILLGFSVDFSYILSLQNDRPDSWVEIGAWKASLTMLDLFRTIPDNFSDTCTKTGPPNPAFALLISQVICEHLSDVSVFFLVVSNQIRLASLVNDANTKARISGKE